jgi:hypothetical protein
MASLYNIKEKKVLFIHIPKTGGISIGTILKKYDMNVVDIVGHQNFKDCIKYVNPDKVFTVIRNPWDWRSSWYHYLKGDHNGHKSGHVSECNQVSAQNFDEHIKWISKADENSFTSTNYHGESYKLFIKSQLSYIEGCDDVDVIRFEDLKNSFESFMSSIGVKIKFNTHVNSSQHKNYKDNYSSESIKLVSELYADDIKEFNYEY